MTSRFRVAILGFFEGLGRDPPLGGLAPPGKYLQPFFFLDPLGCGRRRFLHHTAHSPDRRWGGRQGVVGAHLVISDGGYQCLP